MNTAQLKCWIKEKTVTFKKFIHKKLGYDKFKYKKSDYLEITPLYLPKPILLEADEA